MHDFEPASPNSRILIGILVFLLGLTLYVFLVATGGDWLEAQGIALALQMLYYLIFGILWFWPSKTLFRWMVANRKNKS